MITKLPVLLAFTAIPLLSSCASSNPPCEEINEVNRQLRECAELKKVLYDNKHPQKALTARQLYEEKCVNLRYYRDEYDTICKKDEKAIGERKK
ncbi:hypothetical protein [Alteromonas sp. a30]|uniref:hypothetical protein n=1 Tax=Alteromonas sp. a30 TaxID=2730917 RepID=UPI00227EF770|nr:hypothetical protein [Alteromonas sp. a30]MCY7294143.1 hypothetical protein [Alteromonas sp. a30]